MKEFGAQRQCDSLLSQADLVKVGGGKKLFGAHDRSRITTPKKKKKNSQTKKKKDEENDTTVDFKSGISSSSCDPPHGRGAADEAAAEAEAAEAVADTKSHQHQTQQENNDNESDDDEEEEEEDYGPSPELSQEVLLAVAMKRAKEQQKQQQQQQPSFSVLEGAAASILNVLSPRGATVRNKVSLVTVGDSDNQLQLDDLGSSSNGNSPKSTTVKLTVTGDQQQQTQQQQQQQQQQEGDLTPHSDHTLGGVASRFTELMGSALQRTSPRRCKSGDAVTGGGFLSPTKLGTKPVTKPGTNNNNNNNNNNNIKSPLLFSKSPFSASSSYHTKKNPPTQQLNLASMHSSECDDDERPQFDNHTSTTNQPQQHQPAFLLSKVIGSLPFASEQQDQDKTNSTNEQESQQQQLQKEEQKETTTETNKAVIASV